MLEEVEWLDLLRQVMEDHRHQEYLHLLHYEVVVGPVVKVELNNFNAERLKRHHLQRQHDRLNMLVHNKHNHHQHNHHKLNLMENAAEHQVVTINQNHKLI